MPPGSSEKTTCRTLMGAALAMFVLQIGASGFPRHQDARLRKQLPQTFTDESQQRPRTEKSRFIETLGAREPRPQRQRADQIADRREMTTFIPVRPRGLEIKEGTDLQPEADFAMPHEVRIVSLGDHAPHVLLHAV